MIAHMNGNKKDTPFKGYRRPDFTDFTVLVLTLVILSHAAAKKKRRLLRPGLQNGRKGGV